MIKNTGMESTHTQMVDPTKDNGLKGNSTVKGFSKHRKALKERVYGTKVREYSGLTSNSLMKIRIWKWPNEYNNINNCLSTTII